MRIRTWSEYLYILMLVILLAIVLRWTTISFYLLPSETMVPTIYPKEFVLVNKLAYGLRFTPGGTVYLEQKAKVGEIVLFTLPEREEKMFVKRVIAVSGDFIEIKNGKIFLNDKELITEASSANPKKKNDFGHAVMIKESTGATEWHRLQFADENAINYPRQQVLEGHFFVLNDNRTQLEDSRSFGMVPAKYLLGKLLTNLEF